MLHGQIPLSGLEDRGRPVGHFFDETINNRLRGVSRMESLEIILERCDRTLSREEKLAIATEKNEIYRGLLKAAEYLGLSPLDCLVVEDAVSGLQAAMAADMDAAAVGDAAGSELASYSLGTFAELLDYVN